MDKFDESIKRLHSAVGRLEELLKSKDSNMAAQISKLQDSLNKAEGERESLIVDCDGLRRENDKLRPALREAQEKYAAMQVVNEAVAGRIDSTIKDIQDIVGES